MASFDELVRKKVELFEKVPEKMATAAEKAQASAWRSIEPLLLEMETDSEGNIIQSDNNVRRISQIAEELNKSLATGEYYKAVESFLKSMDEGVNLTTEIAQKIQAGFEPSNAQKQLFELSKQNALSSFFGSGLRQRVSLPFLEQLTANVSARAPLREAINSLRATITGTDTTEGRLLANIKTTALTAQAIADRSFSAAVNDEIGIEWYRYLGGEIPTTREFCQHREGKYFHKKEIEMWGQGKNSAGIDDIKDGTWNGRIPETDIKTIFTFVGGYNCRHYLMPVNESRVPPEVKQRAKSEGYT
jgi:hypothetical protein